MVRFYAWHIDHQAGLVILAGLICLAACLVSLGLTVLARAGGVYRPRIALAAAGVFAAGLAATLFAFMLAFHPAIPFFYRLAATLLSVAAAMAIAWFALAVALSLRAADEAIATGRYPGRQAGQPAAELARLGDAVSRALAASWRGHGRHRGVAAATLIALAICGLDFVAMGGGSPTSGALVAATATSSVRVASSSPSSPRTARPPESVPQITAAPRKAAAPEASADALGLAAAAAGRPVATAKDEASGRNSETQGPGVRDSGVRDSGVRDSGAKNITALATRIAIAQQIDPLLVLAVIATESAFQADAVSPGNAQGLMQLMPETARRFGATDLLDPTENIRAGTRYLRWLLSYFAGDLSLALAAYNAGEGAVIHYGGVPPFPETQAYLRKIRTLYPAERDPLDQLALR
jgi:soluble lytic murein transglycosylase-like protein